MFILPRGFALWLYLRFREFTMLIIVEKVQKPFPINNHKNTFLYLILNELSNKSYIENSSERLRGLLLNDSEASGVFVVLPRPPAHLAPSNYPHCPLNFSFNIESKNN